MKYAPLGLSSLLTLSLLALSLFGCGSDAAVDGGAGCLAASCDSGTLFDAASDAALEAGSDATAPLPDGGAALAPSFAVDVAWLQGNLGRPDVQLVDVRGALSWEMKRIPGSIALEPSALVATVGGIPGQVAPAAAGQAALRAAGVRGDGIAIVYDDSTSMGAARVVWALRYYGHPDVRILDGGLLAWEGAAGALESGAALAPASTFSVTQTLALRVEAADVLSSLSDPNVSLVDARSASEYAGGHIPGAISVDWPQNLSGGAFAPLAEVEALYAAIPREHRVIAYCQSGRRAAMAWLSLSWLGYSDVRLYDGSWNEWGPDPSLPKE